MDQAGVEIGGEELAGRLVEGDVADAGAAIGVDRGKQRNGAGDAVDLPDGAGAAAIALGELPIHEGGAGLAEALPLGAAVGVFVGRHDAQPVQRGRAGVEIGHAGSAVVAGAVIIGQAKDLADLVGQHLERRRRVDELAGRRTAERRNVEDAQRGAPGVDEGFVDRVDARRQAFLDARDDGAGKAGNGHRAGMDDGVVLRVGRVRQPQAGGQRQRAAARSQYPAQGGEAGACVGCSGADCAWRMRLLPVVAGKAAATRAPERASRAIPALSPLIIRCPPLTPATIRRAFRWVNGITESRAGPDLHGDPICAPASCDPREPQHIVSMVMGCSCSRVPHHAAPRQSVAAAAGKGSPEAPKARLLSGGRFG